MMPVIKLSLYFLPFDFNMHPKIIDEIGKGVSVKNTQVFSTNKPFADESLPIANRAMNIEYNEAKNNVIDIRFKMFNGSISFVFWMFPCMYAYRIEFSFKSYFLIM